VRQRKQAFTLVEAMVALAVGSLVLGAAGLLYKNGVKYFYKTTEHAEFREQSLICIETIARDLEQLVVSDGQMPDGTFHMVKPFELTGASHPFTKYNPVTKQEEANGAIAYEGLRFMRYHSTDTSGTGQPTLVGKMIEYTVRPVDGDPAKGKNLYRGDSQRPVNHVPLREIAFVKERPEVTDDQIGASPHSVLTVMIVPMGGSFSVGQNMSQDTVDRLRADRALVSRTFHLSGYETFYTLILNEAFRLAVNAGNNPTQPSGLTGVYKAVYDDARSLLPAARFQAVLNRFQTGSASSSPNFKDVNLYKMDWAAKFDDNTAGTDKFFTNLPVQAGVEPTASGAAGGGATGGGEGEGEGG
jgi:prepilin-type N-terminal cleavage/methylation domain-containing protein